MRFSESLLVSRLDTTWHL